MKNKLEIKNKEDRLIVAKILVDNNYTVRQKVGKKKGKQTLTTYLEYQQNIKDDEEGEIE